MVIIRKPWLGASGSIRSKIAEIICQGLSTNLDYGRTRVAECAMDENQRRVDRESVRAAGVLVVDGGASAVNGRERHLCEDDCRAP